MAFLRELESLVLATASNTWPYSDFEVSGRNLASPEIIIDHGRRTPQRVTSFASATLNLRKLSRRSKLLKVEDYNYDALYQLISGRRRNDYSVSIVTFRGVGFREQPVNKRCG